MYWSLLMLLVREEKTHEQCISKRKEAFSSRGTLVLWPLTQNLKEVSEEELPVMPLLQEAGERQCQVVPDSWASARAGITLPGLPHQVQEKHPSLPGHSRGKVSMHTAEAAGLLHCSKLQWPGRSCWAQTLAKHQSCDLQPLTFAFSFPLRSSSPLVSLSHPK